MTLAARGAATPSGGRPLRLRVAAAVSTASTTRDCPPPVRPSPDLAIVSDFVDEDAYRDYDADPEHNRLRRDLLGPIAEHVERCQFSL